MSAFALLAVPLALALVACDVVDLRDAADGVADEVLGTDHADDVPLTVVLLDAEQAREALANLPHVERRATSLPAYQRRAFGSAWTDVDRNGCNQRDDVLLRDAVPGTVVTGVQGRCQHDVLAGSWIDPYSGARVDLDDLKEPRQAQAIQIDHVVALAEAWRSGAWAWTADQRRQFANDLDVLLAVDGPTNASKSDDDPAAWRPKQAHQCTYARRWTTVKAAWQLGVDPSERSALEDMLSLCEPAGQ